MSNKCYKCGANTKNIGCHAYSSSSSYPSGYDRGGSRSSINSNNRSSTIFNGYSDRGIIEEKSVVIKQPDIVMAVLGDQINLNSVGGWYNPTDLEISRGMNPHFKIMSGDSQQCIAAKQLFNSAINGSLSDSSATGALAFITEVYRVKADLERAKTEIRKNCGSKFDGSFRISPTDFHKYL